MKNIKDKRIALFQGKEIRKIWDDNSEIWYFSVVDIIAAFTDSSVPRRYWSDLKIKLKDEGSQVYDKIVQFKMLAGDNKARETDAADTESVFRIIQSIPSPKAEPFKQWLARVGYERVEEVEDPEKAIQRGLATYLKKGYSKEWVDLRLKNIEIRKDLTDEWNKRDIKTGNEFAILTDDITFAWAGLKTKDYKNFKGLKKENLRDNMTNLELVLNMLAEASTTEISKTEEPKNFIENRIVAKKGGGVAGKARKELEKQIGKSVISQKKFLPNKKKEIKI